MKVAVPLSLWSIVLVGCGGAAAPEMPAQPGPGASAGTSAIATAGSNATAAAGMSGGAGRGAAGASVMGGMNAGGSGGRGAAAGGAAGAAAGAAGSGTGAAACAANDFCDSFESGASALDPERWSVVSPNCSGDGRAELDTEIAHSGTRSLRVRASGGYCNHVFASAIATLPATGPLYGRLFVRFERALTAGHVTFVALRDSGENKDLRMGGQSEILMWNRESDDATLPELSPAGIALSVKPEIDRWLCIEFMLDRAQRRLATWVDGSAVAGLQVEGEPTPDVDAQWLRKVDWMPMPSDAKFGWESYGAEANTLWFDDIALGTARFGCEL